MSERAPLLIEIGCEEIPARMIPAASRELARRTARILDDAGLGRGDCRSWGGSRRLAVRVEEVEGRQADREETVLGPPAKVAFDDAGAPTAAAIGFAKKQGVEPGALIRLETERGAYVGLNRQVRGEGLGELLARSFPRAVEAISFPKVMRWGEGRYRWVRPVHWMLALHGEQVLPVRLFGVAAAAQSAGHRFLSEGVVEVGHPDSYLQSLERACVVVDPDERRRLLASRLNAAAGEVGGVLVEDPALLEEVADLVEWPGVVAGRIDADFLDLPRELLVTTLRHHQKCFSVKNEDDVLLPHFLAVANTDRDPGGHVRRGNEWVIGGRLEDARFFWREDRRRTLADRSADLEKVVLHARLGSYAEKAARVGALAADLARRLSLSEEQVGACARAGALAKNDLVTGTVGEFPELQGRIGGLLLQAEQEPARVWRAVYEHYQPAGPDDDVPATHEGAVVALADKLDTAGRFVAIGEAPTGSRDPFGLRRATSGIFRIAMERLEDLSIDDLCRLEGGGEQLASFLGERMEKFFRDLGYTSNEIRSVVFAESGAKGMLIPLSDVRRRLDAVRGVRDRSDFARLVELTKRIYNIVPKISSQALEGRDANWAPTPSVYEEFVDPEEPGHALQALIERLAPAIEERAASRDYGRVIDMLAEFVTPVARFFDDVLVIDPEKPDESCHRGEMLRRLGGTLTRYFDIRELAGQADRRS